MLDAAFISEFIILLILLLASGFVSAAEIAFFGISPAELFSLKDSSHAASRKVYSLLERPKRLLATLLISVNFINIAIVVISSLMISQLFDFSSNELLGFFVQVVAVTFVIVLFCEVMPKVWATQNALRFSKFSSFPIFILDNLLRPLSSLLVLSSSFVDKRISQKGYDVSMDKLTHAIDITSGMDTPEEEKKILIGIARFSNTDVRQIMKSRIDVIAFDKTMTFPELFPMIVENKYSRIPVYEGSLDSVIGVLYIKDLLPYIEQQSDENFDWLKLLRPAYFVPESKKINDLLQEFQEKKIHLAVVIDEYGGSSGIVTLEDILEEIVGEINDEFDDEELVYSKLDDFTYVFEGKTLINDFCRITGTDRKVFETDKEEDVDTMAGFILELKGGLPHRNEKFEHNGFEFIVESVDRKRIKRVKVNLPRQENRISGNSNNFISLLLPILMLSLLTSCDESYVPKPKGYFRIDLPEKNYILWDSSACPFQFEIPDYARVVPDPSPRAEPCWINIEYPEFKGTLYLSYKVLQNDLPRLIEESRTLSMKHIPKASGIEEELLAFPEENVYGAWYTVRGSTASAIQFYLTDSSQHFIRASLYFYASPNPDSIAPVLKFIEKDVRHMTSSFRWK